VPQKAITKRAKKMGNKKYLPLGQGLIRKLNLSGYTGQSGYTIRITAQREHLDHRVRVVIRDLLGCAIEEGPAQWDATTAAWCYLTTADVRFEEILLITVAVASAHHQAETQVTCVPFDLHFCTEFKTAPWAKAAASGRWKDN
jgi:hypothetical protein